MGWVKKLGENEKRIRELKIGLAVTIIVIIILAGSNIWFAVNKESLEKQIGKLWDDYGYELWWHDFLKAPKLSKLSVYVQEVRPLGGTPYLRIYGEVWNVGTDTAYNCKLHVVAYQGAVIAIDTYIELGTIYGEDKKSIDSNVYYSGSALTSWTITPGWD